MKPTKIVAAGLVPLLLGLLTATAAAAGPEEPATYSVTITNTTEGQYFTPPNWAAHVNGAHVFQLNQPASPGVRSVAENGGVPDLAAELAAALDDADLGDSGVALPTDGSAPVIAPGESRTFIVTSTHDRISIVAMLICTNDGFAGLDAKTLPGAVGQSKQYQLQGYDAGTELNTEADIDLVPAPFCGDPAVGSASGPDEDGVIKRHRGITGAGVLDGSFDWNGPVAEVVIERIG